MAQESESKGTSSAQLVPAYKGTNEVKPLQFNPARLKGLSEKLIVSHHQNNYGGAVRRLNQIQQQIGTLPKDAQPFQMGSQARRAHRDKLDDPPRILLWEFRRRRKIEWYGLQIDQCSLRLARDLGTGFPPHRNVSGWRLGMGYPEL